MPRTAAWPLVLSPLPSTAAPRPVSDPTAAPQPAMRCPQAPCTWPWPWLWPWPWPWCCSRLLPASPAGGGGEPGRPPASPLVLAGAEEDSMPSMEARVALRMATSVGEAAPAGPACWPCSRASSAALATPNSPPAELLPSPASSSSRPLQSSLFRRLSGTRRRG